MQFPDPERPPSSPKLPLQPDEIFKIGYYTGKGMARSKIAQLLKRDPSTISRTIHKYCPVEIIPPKIEHPSLQIPPPCEKTVKMHFSIRPEPITKLLLRHYLIYIVLKDTRLSLRRIAQKMAQKNFPFAIGKTQIHREIRNMHFRSILAIRMPLFSKPNKEYRQSFVQAIRADFRMLLPWLFTDEAAITLNGQRFSVWRVPGILNDEGIFIEQKQFPMRIMV
jgi:hypothetical protein